VARKRILLLAFVSAGSVLFLAVDVGLEVSGLFATRLGTQLATIVDIVGLPIALLATWLIEILGLLNLDELWGVLVFQAIARFAGDIVLGSLVGVVAWWILVHRSS
jgi:hypothetical protein